MSTMELKAGDRVRMVKDGLSTTGAIGMLGTVRYVYPADSRSDHPLQIELDTGGEYKSRAVELEAYRWTWAALDAVEPVASEGDRRPIPAEGQAVASEPIDISEFRPAKWLQVPDYFVIAVKEFLSDWQKGDFELGNLATIDAQDMDHALDRWAAELRVNPPAPSPGALEGMRERVIAILEERAAYFDRTTGHYDREQAARSYRATIDAIRSLPIAEAGTPEDFVLVPVEPTEAMKEAGRNPPHDLVMRDSRSAEERARASAIYRAMIAARPAPPAKGE